MTLKEVRKEYELTQAQAAEIIHMPLRTFSRYENDSKYESTYKYQRAVKDLIGAFTVTEDTGILTLKQIKDIVKKVLDDYKVEYCFLFGSYAKGYCTEKSDVDLMVDGEFEALEFIGLIENLRQTLHKRVDLIRSVELENNHVLLREILKDGIRIYEQHKR